MLARALPAILFAVLAFALPAQGQTMVVGRIDPLDLRFPPPPDDELPVEGFAWVKTFAAMPVRRPRLPESQVLLSDISVHGEGDVSILVTDAFGSEIEVITRQELEAMDEYWTDGGMGAGISIRVRGEHAAEILSFRIAAHAYDTDGLRPEQIFGHNELTPVIDYDGPNKPVVDALEGAIAYLTFRATSGVKGECSGFLTTTGLLFTNFHCISDPAQCPSAKARFGYEKSPGGTLTGIVFHCAAFRGGDPDLDVAILELEGRPQDTWPAVDISQPGTATEGEALLLIQHPGGEAKQISETECSVIARDHEVATEFGHGCDSKHGTSGSPVFATDGTLIGLHRAGHTGAPGARIPNVAVRWTAIAEWLATRPDITQ